MELKFCSVLPLARAREELAEMGSGGGRRRVAVGVLISKDEEMSEGWDEDEERESKEG